MTDTPSPSDTPRADMQRVQFRPHGRLLHPAVLLEVRQYQLGGPGGPGFAPTWHICCAEWNSARRKGASAEAARPGGHRATKSSPRRPVPAPVGGGSFARPGSVCAELCAEDVAVGADDAQHDHSAVVAGDLDERGGRADVLLDEEEQDPDEEHEQPDQADDHGPRWGALRDGLGGGHPCPCHVLGVQLEHAGATYVGAYRWYNNGAALNDSFEVEVVLRPGTWAFEMYVDNASNGGTVTVAVDNGAGGFYPTAFLSHDSYNPTTSLNQRRTATLQIRGRDTIRRRLRFKVTGKNASSSGYQLSMRGFALRRTGDQS